MFSGTRPMRFTSRYVPYHQSQGAAEQVVFDNVSGVASSRSRRLLKALRREFVLSETGRMLDIGSGNGPTLTAFSEPSPGWKLAAADLTDRYLAVIQAIAGVESLYTCARLKFPGNSMSSRWSTFLNT